MLSVVISGSAKGDPPQPLTPPKREYASSHLGFPYPIYPTAGWSLSTKQLCTINIYVCSINHYYNFNKSLQNELEILYETLTSLKVCESPLICLADQNKDNKQYFISLMLLEAIDRRNGIKKKHQASGVPINLISSRSDMCMVIENFTCN